MTNIDLEEYMEESLRKTAIVRMRNYGRIIQDMVQLAANEQDTEKQQAMRQIWTNSNPCSNCFLSIFWD